MTQVKLWTVMSWHIPYMTAERRTLDVIKTTAEVYDMYTDHSHDERVYRIRQQTMQSWRGSLESSKMYRSHYMRMAIRKHHQNTSLEDYTHGTITDRIALFRHQNPTHLEADRCVYGRHTVYRGPKWLYKSKVSLQCRALVY